MRTPDYNPRHRDEDDGSRRRSSDHDIDDDGQRERNVVQQTSFGRQPDIRHPVDREAASGGAMLQVADVPHRILVPVSPHRRPCHVPHFIIHLHPQT